MILAVCLATTALPMSAQDLASLEERVKRLSGYVQDLQEANASQKKQIDELSREVQSLREKQNQPVTPSVGQDDLRKLAKEIQAVDERRKSDNELIAKEVRDIAKAVSNVAKRPIQTPRAESNRPENPPADLPKEAVEHTVGEGEYLSTIAAAYSKEKGVKITTALILKANPGLKPERMRPGQKILIPIPEK